MSQPRDDRQDDLFRPRLEEIVNLRHPLVRLAGEIDWDFKRYARLNAFEHLATPHIGLPSEGSPLVDAAGKNRYGHRDATMVLITYRHGWHD